MLGGAELVEVSSDGEPGDKARFVRGVERALLDGEADIGVHSAKDLPAELTEGLTIAAVPPREDPADAWIGVGSLARRRAGGRAGRHRQPAPPRPAARRAPRPARSSELHGNVDTRLRKLAEGELDAIVLAAAGLRRLGREDEVAFALPAETMTPAAGQGALVAAGPRRRRARRWRRSSAISDGTALRELTAERAVVALLGATCATPARRPRARSTGDRAACAIDAFVGLPDGSEWIRDRHRGRRRPSPTAARRRARRAPARRRRPRASSTARSRDVPSCAPMERTSDAAGRESSTWSAPGPGDPGLMTARSLELIAAADAIFHDRLIPPGALDGAREDAELVYVGKAPGEAVGARRRRSTSGWSRPRGRARASSGSRAATRSSSAAAARRARRCARPGSSSRSSPASPPGSPPPPTPGSRSPTATTPPRSPSSPATRTPRRPRPRSTGRRSPRFPGTLVFYMGVKRLADNAAALIAAGRDAGRARGRGRARHDGRPAHRRRHPGDARRGGRARGDRRPGADRRRAGGRAGARRSPGSSGGRCTAAASSSPAPGPRPAASPRPCAALGAEVVELPAIRIEPRIESDGGAAGGRARSTTTRWSA